MDQETQVDPGHMFRQCREAKLASTTVQVTTIIREGEQVTYTTSSCNISGSGVLEDDDRHFEKTFHGARMHKANKQVN